MLVVKRATFWMKAFVMRKRLAMHGVQRCKWRRERMAKSFG
jgi:hypothetical protein